MIYLPHNHPSLPQLRNEGIEVDDSRAPEGTVRILILNLMPQKQEAEEEYYRALSGAGIDVEILLVKMSNQTYKTTPQAYMDTFYIDIAKIISSKQIYDGMIVSGAPIEQLDFCDVRYWKQLQEVYHWSITHVRSTLSICWAAFAALNIFFDISKIWTAEKLFGVFPHHNENPQIPLMAGLGEEVMVPISRHITLSRKDLDTRPEITTLLDQTKTGPELAFAWSGRQIFATGHMEYALGRLAFEYERDKQKGLPISVPANYFIDNSPEKGINNSWQKSGRQFYSNWLRYYVCNSGLDMKEGAEFSL